MVKKQRMPKRNQSDKNSRITGLVLVSTMLLILVVLGVRFSNVAITKDVKGHKLNEAAQLIYRSQNTVQPKRGEIFDSVGNPLAENATTYTLVAIIDDTQKTSSGKPAYVKPSQDETVAKQLSGILGGEPKHYVDTLKKGRANKLKQVQFGAHGLKIDSQTYKKIMALKIPGITFTNSASRFYPNGVFASNVIGYTTEKNDEKTGTRTIAGLMGIEQKYNKQLTGKAGVKSTSIDSEDTSVSKEDQSAKNGYDIYATINTKLQTTLEDKMQNLYDDMKPKSALAILLDTQTGNIVATTQRPSFNATTGDGIGDYWTNEISESVYEPGSVMKGITLAAAIDTDNWNGDAYYQSGTLKIGDKAVTDWNNGQGWGTITYARGIAESSNVAMALTEQKMGAETWQNYIKKFRFLKSTKSDLPNEETGMMQFKYPIEQANTSYGQAISVTPLQMIQAYTAIAGNGEEIQPHLVEKVVDPNSKKVVYQAKRKVVSKPIKKSTAEATRKQLEDVIYSEYGLGKAYAIPNVRTTGKSGTAQIATSTGYSTPGDNNHEIHSWMGMAPSDDPRYLMYIVTKEPQQNTENIAKDMSDMFITVMQQALQSSDEDNKVVVSADQQVTVPTVVVGSTAEAEKEVAAANLTPLVMGDGDTIKQQTPAGGQKSLTNQRVFLNTGKNIAVPDMHGWSKSDVLAWAKLADIKPIIKGDGFVATQSINPDTQLADGYHEITVEFKNAKAE